MANIFTSNQVNHVYVATALKTSNGKVAKSDAVGTISVQQDAEGNMYFMHRGQGGLTRSDLITNIMDIRYTPASKMSREMNAARITINSAALSSSNPVVGQDYLLRLEFQNPIGMSPDNKYWKYGIVHVASGETPSTFYKKMAISLAKNFARSGGLPVRVGVVISSTFKEVTSDMTTSSSAISGSATSLEIREVKRSDWEKGTKQDKITKFTIIPSTINTGSSDVYWADVVYSGGEKLTGGAQPESGRETTAGNIPTGDTLINSRLAAELEYFALGERADLYRNVGWPDSIASKCIIGDPDSTTYQYGFDMINIHYAYVGSNHAVQKSEKDITIIAPSNSGASGLGTVAAAIKGAIDAIPREAKISGAATSGKLTAFDSSGNIVATAKAPGDIS